MTTAWGRPSWAAPANAGEVFIPAEPTCSITVCSNVPFARSAIGRPGLTELRNGPFRLLTAAAGPVTVGLNSGPPQYVCRECEIPRTPVADRAAKMTVAASPDTSRHSGLPASQGQGSWPSEVGVRRIAELPKTIGDWSLTQITAGLWLSTATADVPADALALEAEPGRPSLALQLPGADAGFVRAANAVWPDPERGCYQKRMAVVRPGTQPSWDGPSAAWFRCPRLMTVAGLRSSCPLWCISARSCSASR